MGILLYRVWPFCWRSNDNLDIACVWDEGCSTDHEHRRFLSNMAVLEPEYRCFYSDYHAELRSEIWAMSPSRAKHIELHGP